MGNLQLTWQKVCGSADMKKSVVNPSKEEEEYFLARNQDNYFRKKDFEQITVKFAEYPEWMLQSKTPFKEAKRKNVRFKWKSLEIIGRGSFATVIKGINLDTGSLMAVKQVIIEAKSISDAQQNRIRALEVEIDLLSSFTHKNIVNYYGSERNNKTFNIFLEYISGGTIASILEKYGPFTENLVRIFTKQILEGLEYLHVRNTIHRDIKGANILVNKNGVCKLTDFGTAKRISALFENDQNYVPSLQGTPNWMAPEVIRQSSMGRFCDIWSVGCTVIEMFTAKPPWHDEFSKNTDAFGLLYKIGQAKSPPPYPKDISNDARDFLNKCFKLNPKNRPNVIKLLEHKFITGVEKIDNQEDIFSRFPSQSPQKSNGEESKRRKTGSPVSIVPSSPNNSSKILIKVQDTSIHNANEEAMGTFRRKSPMSAEGRPPKKGSEHFEESKQHPVDQTVTSELESFGAIPNLIDGIRTPKGSSVLDLEIKPVIIDQKKVVDNKGKRRPLGKKAGFPFKSGYAHLDEDSVSGMSFIVTPNLATLQEIDEKNISRNAGTTPVNGSQQQGKIFFPDPLQQEELNGVENKETNREWERTRNERIEEENEDVENEKTLHRQKTEDKGGDSMHENHKSKSQVENEENKNINLNFKEGETIDENTSEQQSPLKLGHIFPHFDGEGEEEIDVPQKLKVSKSKSLVVTNGENNPSKTFGRQKSDFPSARGDEAKENNANELASNREKENNKIITSELKQVMKLQFIP